MLTGFVLLITSTVNVMPVSERIYPTLASCEQVRQRVLERRPMAQLECGEVRR